MLASTLSIAVAGAALAAAGVNAAALPEKRAPIVSGLTVKQTTSNSWSYSRCQWDQTLNTLSGYSFVSTSMTADLCATTCETKGFSLAGVEWGNTCYCGNSYNNGYAINDWECTKFACTGDSTSYCGGATALQVYSRGAAWTSSSSAAAASTSSSLSVAAASTSASISASIAAAASSVASVAAASQSASISASVAAASAAASVQAASVSASISASVSAASAAASAQASSVSASISASVASASASASAAAALATSTPAPWVRAAAACVAEGKGGRALNGASTSAADMTYYKCLSFCASKGFSIAGVEYSSECYCGNSLVNGASLNIASTQCNMPCAGSPTQTCGGPDALTVFVVPSKVSALNTDLTVKAAPLPTGWNAASTACVAEGSTGRALTGAATAADNMTPAQCATYCAAQGFSIAGVEYGRECYCGNTLVNGAALTKPSAQCNMPCGGDANGICGGPGALNIYVNPAVQAIPAASSGMSSKGCIQEVAGRALTGQRFDFADMTVDKCTTACKAVGFSMAGVEYGTECYCGNSLVNGASTALVSGQCVMNCPGNSALKCGGPNALQLYSL